MAKKLGGPGSIRAVYAQGLKDLVEAIRACDRTSKTVFKDLIVVAIKLMSVTTATELAERLHHNKSTISKWMSDPEAAPARATREVTIIWIEEQAVKRLASLKTGLAYVG